MILYAATSNPGKLREFALLADKSVLPDVQICPLPGLREIEAPPETGETFEQIACEKAIYYSGFSTEPVFADDSGLEVEALHGAPGILSARFAGIGATDEQNNRLLLQSLRGKSRSAKFVCTLALASHKRVMAVVRGEVQGQILEQERGTAGFGYDPLFFYPPLNRTFAELSPEEKQRISHRGLAARKLFLWLADHPDAFGRRR